MGITNPPSESASLTSPISPVSPIFPAPQNLWNTEKVQLREYQQNIFERAQKEHLMVVIPPGLGPILKPIPKTYFYKMFYFLTTIVLVN